MNLLCQPGSIGELVKARYIQCCKETFEFEMCENVKEDLIFSDPDAKPKTHEHYRTLTDILKVSNVEISALSSPHCSSSTFPPGCTSATWSTRGSMDRGGGGGDKGEGQHQ